jgi:D-3-phosphoglycerate dehydrogenase
MVVDDEALRDHILSGHLSGAAIDVFPTEPKAQGDPFESPLRGLDNVILTPHVGGSTQEAQEEIGSFVATKLLGFVASGATSLSVNLPEVVPPPPPAAFRMGYLHQNVPGVLASINRTLADAGANIVGQSLSTRGEHGYVVTDTNVALAEETLSALRGSPEAIWLRTWAT